MFRTSDDVLKQWPVGTGSAHLAERATRFADELAGSVELEYVAVTQHEDAIVVQYGLEPVCNGDNDGAGELFADGTLDL